MSGPNPAAFVRLLVLAAVLAPGAGGAATVRVPADASTIGLALAAAGAGDTVLVAPGTYVERVVLPSNVTLRGEGAPGAAIIDAALGGPCVDVGGGAEFTRLEGFRLVRGRGRPDPGGATGGALHVQGGLLAVRDCTFDDGEAAFGGGTAGIAAHLTFRRCTWLDGQATFGGGHFQAAGSVLLEDAVFDAPAAERGGGVFATNSASVTVHGAAIRGARASGDGGGLHLDACVATLSALRVEDAVALGRGGGLSIAAGGQVLASFCTFLRNTSGGGGGAFHVSCDATAPARDRLAADCALLSLTHSDLLVNTGASPAAGAVSGTAVVRIASSIVVGNTSGLACLDSRAVLDVTCSDLYANGGPDLGGACAPAGDPDNRSVDPHLCNLEAGDVGLCSNSPLAIPGCDEALWGSAGVRCGACGPTPAAPTTWGRMKARYR